MDLPGCQNTFEKIPTQPHTLHTLPLPRSLGSGQSPEPVTPLRLSALATASIKRRLRCLIIGGIGIDCGSGIGRVVVGGGIGGIGTGTGMGGGARHRHRHRQEGRRRRQRRRRRRRRRPRRRLRWRWRGWQERLRLRRLRRLRQRLQLAQATAGAAASTGTPILRRSSRLAVIRETRRHRPPQSSPTARTSSPLPLNMMELLTERWR